MIYIGLHVEYFAQLARSYIRIKLRVKITIHESIRKAQPHLHGRAVPFLIPYSRTSESYSYAKRIC